MNYNEAIDNNKVDFGNNTGLSNNSDVCQTTIINTHNNTESSNPHIYQNILPIQRI